MHHVWKKLPALESNLEYKWNKSKGDRSCNVSGTILSNNVLNHLESRVQTARRAQFTSLQSAGLCKNGVHATTMAHITNTAVCPVMTYGCSNINT